MRTFSEHIIAVLKEKLASPKVFDISKEKENSKKIQENKACQILLNRLSNKSAVQFVTRNITAHFHVIKWFATVYL